MMCKYCDLENYEQSALKESMYIDIGIYHIGINNYYLHVETEFDLVENASENVVINYCPMCGRKLVDE